MTISETYVVTQKNLKINLILIPIMLKNKPNSNLSFSEVTIHTILSIIDFLKPKTSSGMDEISNKTLTPLRNEINAPRTVIINQMLYTGPFSDAPKVWKVIQLHKKDDKQLFSNYKPIFLLPSISKIFERAILIQLTEYLNNIDNILHYNQYGF